MSRFLFPEWTNTFRRWVGVLVVGGGIYTVALIGYAKQPETIRIGYAPEQPVPYSHALHAGELGLECQYCHNTVTESGHAAVPPVETCMNCHHGIRHDSKKLTPVREAYAAGEPLEWVRIHDLPDYVYFNHAAHVNRGVGCESCHGRIDEMEVVYQAKALTMGWCLECHREPEKHLRPLDKITVMGYEPEGGDQIAVGKAVQEQYGIQPRQDCSTCHR